MTPQRIVLGAWLAMIGLATVRAVAGPQKGMPAPSIYLGSGILFTALYGASSFLGPLAAAIAVGVDVAAVAAPYIHKNAAGLPEPLPGPLNQLAGFLDGISGGPSASAPGGGQGNLTPAP